MTRGRRFDVYLENDSYNMREYVARVRPNLLKSRGWTEGVPRTCRGLSPPINLALC